jgi:hypothetical protein
VRFWVGLVLLDVLKVGGRQAPRCVIRAGAGTALSAGLLFLLDQALENSRLLEAPVASLFHSSLPLVDS